MRIEEWVLVGLCCVLVPVGVLYVVKPQKISPDVKYVRRLGWILIFIGGGMLCDLLPRRLGAGHDVQGAFLALAVLSAIPTMILAVYNVHAYSRSKRSQAD